MSSNDLPIYPLVLPLLFLKHGWINFRGVFIRILSLHSLSDWWEERESNSTSAPPQQLTTLFLKNSGHVIYPSYNIIRQRHIFKDRQDLIQFEEACSMESAVAEAADSKVSTVAFSF